MRRRRRTWRSTATGPRSPAARRSSTPTTTPASRSAAPNALIDDQDGGVGWSAWNPNSPDNPDEQRRPAERDRRAAAPVDVSAIGIDPAATCGDGASATLKGYRLEVASPTARRSGPTRAGEFAAAQAGNLNLLEPAGDLGDSVQRVRLTLLSPQNECDVCSGRDFIDVSALEVFGAVPNVLPSGSLTATPATAATGQAVTLDASSFTDPDSLITGYDWDFDGDNVTDRSDEPRRRRHSPTTRPALTSRRSRVKDFRGGAGTASTTVTVSRAAGARRVTPGGGSGSTPPSALPVIAIARSGSKGRFTVQVTCASRCELSGKLTVTRKVARRLGLARLTLRRLERTIRSTRRQTIR